MLLGGASSIRVWTQRTAPLIAASPFLSPYVDVLLSPFRVRLVWCVKLI